MLCENKKRLCLKIQTHWIGNTMRLEIFYFRFFLLPFHACLRKQTLIRDKIQNDILLFSFFFLRFSQLPNRTLIESITNDNAHLFGKKERENKYRNGGFRRKLTGKWSEEIFVAWGLARSSFVLVEGGNLCRFGENASCCVYITNCLNICP